MIKKLLLATVLQVAAAVHVYNSPADLPTVVPAACRAALSANITCPELIPANLVAHAGRLTASELSSVCVAGCSTSLQTFVSNVKSRCGSTVISTNGTNITAVAIAEPLLWAYNTSCAVDRSTKGLCYPTVSNGTAKVCSDCFLQYEASLLGSDYGRGRIDPPSFSSLLSSCSKPASSYPYATPTTSSVSTPRPTITALVPTCSGTTYKVAKGDTCRSIASSHSIAEDRFIVQNGLDYNCNSLSPGNTVCLGPSCTLLVVQKNMTCSQILQGKPYYLNQLRSWNPTIHAACDNLDTMVGRGICISPPGSNNYTISSYTTPTATPFTMFTGSFVSGGRASPAPTNFVVPSLATTFSVTTTTATVNVTQANLIDSYSQYCPITQDDYDLGFSWDDLPAACSSLLAPYCTPNPNAAAPKSTRFPAVCTPTTATPTPTSTQNATPSPLTPGTTANCKGYYKVAQSDTCYGIATNYKITVDQFNTWNPYVGTNCTRLLLCVSRHLLPSEVSRGSPLSVTTGYYVCVSA